MLRTLAAIFAGFTQVVSYAATSTNIVWPTPSESFMQGKHTASWAQPTASGILESALFGCVRSGGAKFHEGIDIAPVQRDRKGEATDAVYAAMDGRVAYIAERNGLSSYGRYIVLEHDTVEPAVYTLYAHLAAVDKNLRIGQQIPARTPIGTMGRSATGYSIPKHRAHLHFEIGLRLSDQFQNWYIQQADFGSSNPHGNYHGFNLSGLDPLPLFEQVRDGQFRDMQSYIRSLPTAFVLRVATGRVPDFVKRYPALLAEPLPKQPLMGWDVEFSPHGLPKRWRPLFDTSDPLLHQRGNVTLLYFDEALLRQSHCRDLIELTGAEPQLEKQLKRSIELLFTFH